MTNPKWTFLPVHPKWLHHSEFIENISLTDITRGKELLMGNITNFLWLKVLKMELKPQVLSSSGVKMLFIFLAELMCCEVCRSESRCSPWKYRALKNRKWARRVNMTIHITFFSGFRYLSRCSIQMINIQLRKYWRVFLSGKTDFMKNWCQRAFRTSASFVNEAQLFTSSAHLLNFSMNFLTFNHESREIGLYNECVMFLIWK